MTGTSGGSGKRDATQPLRDKEEGLASVEVEANRGTEGPSLSTMWRSLGGPTRKLVCTQVASAHNNSQSAVYKLQAGRYGYTTQTVFSAQNDLDSSSSWVKICTAQRLQALKLTSLELRANVNIL